MKNVSILAGCGDHGCCFVILLNSRAYCCDPFVATHSHFFSPTSPGMSLTPTIRTARLIRGPGGRACSNSPSPYDEDGEEIDANAAATKTKTSTDANAATTKKSTDANAATKTANLIDLVLTFLLVPLGIGGRFLGQRLNQND